jgi:hypothetical protein
MAYAYDAANRLLGVSGSVNETYAYDASSGNLSQKNGQSLSCGIEGSKLSHAVVMLDDHGKVQKSVF